MKSQISWLIGPWMQMKRHCTVIAAVVALPAVLVATSQQAVADIDVTLSPVNNVVSVGDTVEIQVIVSSDSSVDQLMAAMDLIFSWETPYLQLIGLDQTGATTLLSSSFPPNDPYGINDGNSPPEGGLGLYTALGPLGNPVEATPAGTLITTFLFEALAVTNSTPIDIVESAGDPEGFTIVFDGTVPNLPVTGVLTGTTITIIPAPGGMALLAIAMLTGARTRRRQQPTAKN